MKKKWTAWVLLLAIAVSCLTVQNLYAANSIETDKNDCTISVHMPGSADGSDEYSKDLADAKVILTGNLYRIADVNKYGELTSTEAFSSIAIEDKKPGEENWKEVAETAKKLVEDSKDNPILPDKTFAVDTTVDTNIIDGLSTGVYMLLINDGTSNMYVYSFSPILISVPDNLYYTTGKTEDDHWIYDPSVVLKAERTSRDGGLTINKTLEKYDPSLGNPTFVFTVEAVDKQGKTVYSNVISYTFTGPGTKSVVIDKLPVGATVTITEVYTGASYKNADGKITKTVVIEPDSEEKAMAVNFDNTYDGKLVPSHGVTNHFDYNDGWNWTTPKDSTTEKQ